VKTEEILRREAEYRVIREALGTYHVDLVAALPAPVRPPNSMECGAAGDSMLPPEKPGDSGARGEARARSEPAEASGTEPPASASPP